METDKVSRAMASWKLGVGGAGSRFPEVVRSAAASQKQRELRDHVSEEGESEDEEEEEV